MSPKQPESSGPYQFPDGFLWGASTAAHQVEGHQDNNWSRWEPKVADRLAETAPARLQGLVPDWDLIRDEATDPDAYISGEAADHSHRYEEDFDLMRSLGLNAHRFSVEWSRIEPEPGEFDQAALDHYEAVVDALRDRGIEPFLVLHHFTNPQWLEDVGGWHHPDTPELFVRYTEAVVRRLGGKVQYWITINEASGYIFMKYLDGDIWPAWPGSQFSVMRAWRARKHFAEAHKAARECIRTSDPGASVGFVHTGEVFRGDGRMTNAIARLAKYFTNRYIVRPVTKHCDFIPMHHYCRWRVMPGFTHPKNWIQPHDTDTKNDMGWGVNHESIYEAVRMYADAGVPIYIDEHGLADARDGHREEFITQSLIALHRAIEEGVDVRGYFHWSLLDNFEWSEGFWPKFGLVEVDRTTQERRIRPSAYTYQRIAHANEVNEHDKD